MKGVNADWLARVEVDGCARTRSQEVAELAVDLALVALQIVAPNLDTHTMARLDAHRGTGERRTISETGGFHSIGWQQRRPGMAIGQGTLAHVVQVGAPLIESIGNVVRSFTSGVYRLPAIEMAWCDAAYWFHQALSEPVETIAIAKLETSLEVLLKAENAKGSTQRILKTLQTFFDLAPDDPVAPGSMVDARSFAARVVRDRSRILHGTWSTLNTRGMDRDGMEAFVRSVLRSAVSEMEGYIALPDSCDDMQDMLAWVERRKGKTSTVFA